MASPSCSITNPFFVVLVFAFGISGPCVSAEFVLGEAVSPDNMMLVSQFCFDFWSGPRDTSVVSGLVNPMINNQNFMFFNDSAQSWPIVEEAINSNTLTCSEMTDLAEASFDFSSAFTKGDSEQIELQLEQYSGIHTIYVVAVNCIGSLQMSFALQFTNPGGYFRAQFSCEDMGLLQLYLVVSAIISMIAATHCHAMRLFQRSDIGSLHPVLRLLSASFGLQATAVACITLHLLVYAADGAGLIVLKWVGEGCDAASHLAFIALLLLLARGWTVTTRVLPARLRQSVLVACAGCCLALLFLLAWQAGAYGGPTFSVWDSLPGLVLACLRLAVAFLFLFFVNQSLQGESHPPRARFFRLFGVVFGTWLVMVPALPLLAAAAVGPYRGKVAGLLAYLFCTLLGFAAMLWLLWPSRAHYTFDLSPPQPSSSLPSAPSDDAHRPLVAQQEEEAAGQGSASTGRKAGGGGGGGVGVGVGGYYSSSGHIAPQAVATATAMPYDEL